MASPAPILSPTDDLVDSYFAGHANAQKQPYDFGALQDKYPVRPVLPVQTMPLENQIAWDAARTQMQGQNLELQRMQFRNTAEQSNFTYQQKVLQQAQDAMQSDSGITSLNPSSPDYPAQRAKFIQRYPLGNQESSVAHALSNLDQTYHGLQQNAQVLDNHSLMTARNLLANDPQALNDFEVLMQQNQGNIKDPVMLASGIANQRRQIALESQLKSAGVTDLSPFRSDVNDPTSPLDETLARTAINRFSEEQKQKDAVSQKEAMERAYTNRPLSQRDYMALVEAKNKIMSRNDAAGSMTEDDKAELEPIQQQINQYLQSRGISKPSPTPASSSTNRKPLSAIFGP